MSVEATPREKSGIPKNPGRAELGMKATLLFPNKDIVEQYYVPLIYTACRTCYSELPPEEIEVEDLEVDDPDEAGSVRGVEEPPGS